MGCGSSSVHKISPEVIEPVIKKSDNAIEIESPENVDSRIKQKYQGKRQSITIVQNNSLNQRDLYNNVQVFVSTLSNEQKSQNQQPICHNDISQVNGYNNYQSEFYDNNNYFSGTNMDQFNASKNSQDYLNNKEFSLPPAGQINSNNIDSTCQALKKYIEKLEKFKEVSSSNNNSEDSKNHDRENNSPQHSYNQQYSLNKEVNNEFMLKKSNTLSPAFMNRSQHSSFIVGSRVSKFNPVAMKDHAEFSECKSNADQCPNMLNNQSFQTFGGFKRKTNTFLSQYDEEIDKSVQSNIFDIHGMINFARVSPQFRRNSKTMNYDSDVMNVEQMNMNNFQGAPIQINYMACPLDQIKRNSIESNRSNHKEKAKTLILPNTKKPYKNVMFKIKSKNEQELANNSHENIGVDMAQNPNTQQNKSNIKENQQSPKIMIKSPSHTSLQRYSFVQSSIESFNNKDSRNLNNDDQGSNNMDKGEFIQPKPLLPLIEFDYQSDQDSKFDQDENIGSDTDNNISNNLQQDQTPRDNKINVLVSDKTVKKQSNVSSNIIRVSESKSTLDGQKKASMNSRSLLQSNSLDNHNKKIKKNSVTSIKNSLGKIDCNGSFKSSKGSFKKFVNFPEQINKDKFFSQKVASNSIFDHLTPKVLSSKEFLINKKPGTCLNQIKNTNGKEKGDDQYQQKFDIFLNEYRENYDKRKAEKPKSQENGFVPFSKTRTNKKYKTVYSLKVKNPYEGSNTDVYVGKRTRCRSSGSILLNKKSDKNVKREKPCIFENLFEKYKEPDGSLRRIKTTSVYGSINSCNINKRSLNYQVSDETYKDSKNSTVLKKRRKSKFAIQNIAPINNQSDPNNLDEDNSINRDNNFQSTTINTNDVFKIGDNNLYCDLNLLEKVTLDGYQNKSNDNSIIPDNSENSYLKSRAQNQSVFRKKHASIVQKVCDSNKKYSRASTDQSPQILINSINQNESDNKPPDKKYYDNTPTEKRRYTLKEKNIFLFNLDSNDKIVKSKSRDRICELGKKRANGNQIQPRKRNPNPIKYTEGNLTNEQTNDYSKQETPLVDCPNTKTADELYGTYSSHDQRPQDGDSINTAPRNINTRINSDQELKFGEKVDNQSSQGISPFLQSALSKVMMRNENLSVNTNTDGAIQTNFTISNVQSSQNTYTTDNGLSSQNKISIKADSSSRGLCRASTNLSNRKSSFTNYIQNNVNMGDNMLFFNSANIKELNEIKIINEEDDNSGADSSHNDHSIKQKNQNLHSPINFPNEKSFLEKGSQEDEPKQYGVFESQDSIKVENDAETYESMGKHGYKKYSTTNEKESVDSSKEIQKRDRHSSLLYNSDVIASKLLKKIEDQKKQIKNDLSPPSKIQNYKNTPSLVIIEEKKEEYEQQKLLSVLSYKDLCEYDDKLINSKIETQSQFLTVPGKSSIHELVPDNKLIKSCNSSLFFNQFKNEQNNMASPDVKSESASPDKRSEKEIASLLGIPKIIFPNKSGNLKIDEIDTSLIYHPDFMNNENQFNDKSKQNPTKDELNVKDLDISNHKKEDSIIKQQSNMMPKILLDGEELSVMSYSPNKKKQIGEAQQLELYQQIIHNMLGDKNMIQNLQKMPKANAKPSNSLCPNSHSNNATRRKSRTLQFDEIPKLITNGVNDAPNPCSMETGTNQFYGIKKMANLFLKVQQESENDGLDNKCFNQNRTQNVLEDKKSNMRNQMTSSNRTNLQSFPANQDITPNRKRCSELRQVRSFINDNPNDSDSQNSLKWNNEPTFKCTNKLYIEKRFDGTKLINEYLLMAKIGTGGFSKVFKALNKNNNQFYVIFFKLKTGNESY